MGTPLTKIKEQFFAEMGGSPNCITVPTTGALPVVNVELSDEGFKRATELTFEWFTARKGYVVYRPINVQSGVNDYQMQKDVQQVLSVVFEVPTDVAAFFSLGFFDLIPYGPQNVGSLGTGLTNYSGFSQLIQFNEQRKRVFSVQPEFWYEQQQQILHITNRQGALQNMMLVECNLGVFDPQNLNDKDDWLFGRYLRAKCKEIVGRIRSKYDSLPGAGGNIALDGKELIAEAKEEFEKLDKEIFASQGPDPIVTG